MLQCFIRFPEFAEFIEFNESSTALAKYPSFNASYDFIELARIKLIYIVRNKNLLELSKSLNCSKFFNRKQKLLNVIASTFDRKFPFR